MKNSPHVSVIIPVRNEAAYIEGCLNAILDQDYNGNIEIIIVDGMSTDNSREIYPYQEHQVLAAGRHHL